MARATMIFRPENQSKIPTRAGVYAFCLNLFQKSNLGLYESETPTTSKILEAKRALKRKLVLVEKLKSRSYLSGQLDSYTPYHRQQFHFSGKMMGGTVAEPSQDISDLGDREFLLYLELAEAASPLSQPIYCGMTVGQDLRTRYSQHFKNYEEARQNTFGGRLSESGLDWTDLLFVCSPATLSDNHEASIKMLERHMMFLFNPIMSVK